MQLSIVVGVALVAWLALRNWSMTSRLLLAVGALLLGWEPASSGNQVGAVLVTVAAGVAASVVWDLLPGRRRRLARARRAQARAASRRGQLLVGRGPSPGPEPGRAVLPAAVQAPVPAPPSPGPDPMTELDRADDFGLLLDANVAALQEAQRTGDVLAQAAYAGEISNLAQAMRGLLRVVAGERQRLRG